MSSKKKFPFQKYDWDGWFAKHAFMLVRGKHYVCSQSAMCQQIRNEASKRQMTITVSDLQDRISVTVNWRPSVDPPLPPEAIRA